MVRLRLKAVRMYICSWRLFGTENYDTAFDVFRDGEKIATVTDSTNYTDSRVGTSYTVVPSGESGIVG